MPVSLRACVPGGRAAMISSCRSLPRDVRAVGRKAPSVYRAGTRDGSIYILSTYQSSFRQVFFFLEGSEVCLSLYISISYKLVNKREERQLRYCSQGSQRDGPSCHGGASPAWSPSRSSRIIMWRMRHGRSFCGA